MPLITRQKSARWKPSPIFFSTHFGVMLWTFFFFLLLSYEFLNSSILCEKNRRKNSDFSMQSQRTKRMVAVGERRTIETITTAWKYCSRTKKCEIKMKKLNVQFVYEWYESKKKKPKQKKFYHFVDRFSVNLRGLTGSRCVIPITIQLIDNFQINLIQKIDDYRHF